MQVTGGLTLGDGHQRTRLTVRIST